MILTLLIVTASIATGAAIYNFLNPKEEEDTALKGLVVDRTKDISSFSRLDPNKTWDRVELFLGRTLKQEEKLEALYNLMGRPDDIDPLKMLRKKEIYAGVLAALFGFMFYSKGLPHVGVIAGALIGYVMPSMTWGSQIKKRQSDIVVDFSSFVDLSALVIESGLDYITAFERIIISSKQESALNSEVKKMLSEIQLGYSRRDALNRFADRCGVSEVRSFVGLLVQSDELGTSLVELLINYSVDLRFRRVNKAEKIAAQASTKMLFPIIFFIFPVVFLLLLAPMVGDLMRSFGSGG